MDSVVMCGVGPEFLTSSKPGLIVPFKARIKKTIQGSSVEIFSVAFVFWMFSISKERMEGDLLSFVSRLKYSLGLGS